jgi:predicted kinase
MPVKCLCCGPKKTKEKPVTTLTMTKGLPGSGKTTWAREQVLKAIPGSVVIVCKDDLRAMLHADRWHGKNERQVVKARDALVEMFLLQGVSVIVADTNLNPYHEERLERLAESRGARFFVKDFTDVALNTCVRRDLKREKSVGEKVIRDMYEKYLAPKPTDPPALLPDRPHAVLVDLDGTLAKMADRSPFDWDRVDEDTAHQDSQADPELAGPARRPVDAAGAAADAPRVRHAQGLDHQGGDLPAGDPGPLQRVDGPRRPRPGGHDVALAGPAGPSSGARSLLKQVHHLKYH